jgi:nucleoside-diphosphate-sugar epimerase
MSRKKNILITGTDGLLGKQVANSCIRMGFQVYGVVRRMGYQDRGIAYIALDLSNSWSLDVLPSKIDVVVHLAQSNRFRDFPEGAEDLFGVNVATTAKLLNYTLKAGGTHFIYASTGGVYLPDSGQLNEDSRIHEPGRLGAYFGTKICGEILVHSYSSFMTTTILRPFFIYGRGQKRDMLLPRILDRVKAGHAIQLQGGDGIRINPVHVDDAAEAIMAAIDSPLSAVVNIAGPEVLSIRQVAEGFGAYLNRPPVFELLSGKPHDLIADISLMRLKLYEPTRQLLNHIEDVAI